MRVPVSTYRLQVTEEFDLFEVARRLPYLHDLGADWVYLSPLLAAETKSAHGYDVVAHDHIDESRGGAAGLDAVVAEARRLGLGVLIDIVPNHVGIATPRDNPWWWDLLENGRDSAHAEAFDIDWDAGAGRIRIPIVGDDDWDPSSGRIANLEMVDDELRYHDHRLPIAPRTARDGEDANVVHDRQHYQLVHWKVADDGLNYRRFFAVNTLAGVRVEDPDVLADSHVEIRRWFDDGLADGLRVDHPDGLRDPRGYLDDLATMTGGAYVLVEKILEPGERLPTTWATAGTTGYGVLGMIDRVLTDSEGQAPLDALESRLRGAPFDWHQLIHDTKREVADGILRSEVNRVTRELVAAGVHVDHGVIADVVAELAACFPVYRSYLPEGRDHLDRAVELARHHRPDLDPALDPVAAALADPESPPAQRFQQTTGAVMAKGVEDCAFYRVSRLTSLNEVGGDPSEFSLRPADFHTLMTARQAERPHAMTTLSTHDTKRGEDVRARITALAELPYEWEAALDRFLELSPLPDPGFGSLLWQAVLGAWPASRERLHAYAEKAMREAGDRTTWTAPDLAYEDAVHAAVDAVFDNGEVRAALDGLLELVVAPGWSNSMAAKLMALTMPGVPDVYQGSELWEQSLVDPDNRRFVDFDARAELLADLGDPPPLTALPDDPGAAKLLVTHRALTLRRDRPELFTTYSGLTATGPAAAHVVAFDRGGAITVVTRLPVGLERGGGWGETTLELPEGEWVDVISGRSVGVSTGSANLGAPLADVLATYPVALLTRVDG